MKNIFLVLLLLSFSCNLDVYGVSESIIITPNTVKEYKKSVDNLPFGQYLKYYRIDSNSINLEYINLSDREEKEFLKKLSKEEKQNYKYVKKVEKLVKKGDWAEVFRQYPHYFPAHIEFYNACLKSNNYPQALYVLGKIKNLDPYSQIYSKELIDYSLGALYFDNGQYAKALEYFKMYEYLQDDYIYSSIANCYYYMKNYKLAIDYTKKIKKLSYQDKELLYSSSIRLENFSAANSYARDLLNEKYNFTNLMRVQATTKNEDEKLTYCYRARTFAINDIQLADANKIIADIEQKRLDKKASSLTQFIKIPKWEDIQKQIPQNISGSEISRKQDEFFNTANSYLKKYSGQQLTNAFNSLNQDYMDYIRNTQNLYYKEQQLQAQEALIREQQRQNYLQQEMIREQQIYNSLEMDRMYYYMTRPYYYMYPGRFGWWW